jgi:hypothetical protein
MRTGDAVHGIISAVVINVCHDSALAIGASDSKEEQELRNGERHINILVAVMFEL